MKIYIDSEYLCHVENAEGRLPIETDFFDGKCKSFIESYRYIPDGKSWTRKDGTVFRGIMVSPVINYDILSKIQEQYEFGKAQMEDMQTALEILGVSP